VIKTITLTSGMVNGIAVTNVALPSNTSLSGTFINPTFGTLVSFVQKGLLPIANQVDAIPAVNALQSIFHLHPGVELRNPDKGINNGDITVVSNWNLAAGVMSNLQSSSNLLPAVFALTDVTANQALLPTSFSGPLVATLTGGTFGA